MINTSTARTWGGRGPFRHTNHNHGPLSREAKAGTQEGPWRQNSSHREVLFTDLVLWASLLCFLIHPLGHLPRPCLKVLHCDYKILWRFLLSFLLVVWPDFSMDILFVFSRFGETFAVTSLNKLVGPCLPCSLRQKHRMQKLFTLTSVAFPAHSASWRELFQSLVSVIAMIISPAKEGPQRCPKSPPICLSGFPARYPLHGGSGHWRQVVNTLLLTPRWDGGSHLLAS